MRGLGLKVSPSMSGSSNAERIMGRLSASRAQSAALSEAAEEYDQSPKVTFLSLLMLLRQSLVWVPSSCMESGS